MEKTKKCNKCGEIKPIAEYHVQKSTKDGLKHHCKACAKKARRAYYQKNKAKENAQSKAFREANPEYWNGYFSATRQSGCYSITCTANGKIYYGSSSHLYRRQLAHQGLLKSGTHWIEEMQSDFYKYGEEAFVFDVVCYCEPRHLRANEAELVNEWLNSSLSYNQNRIVSKAALK